MYFGLHAGVILERIGVRVCSSIGVLALSTGALLLFASATNRIAGNVFTVSIFSLIMCAGFPFLDIAGTVTISQNFANHRTVAVGCVKSILGLAASIMAQFFSGFFLDNIFGFIAFTALPFPLLGLAGTLFIEPLTSKDRKDPFRGWTKRRLDVLQFFVVLLQVYVLAVAFVSRVFVLSAAVRMAIALFLVQ